MYQLIINTGANGRRVGIGAGISLEGGDGPMLADYFFRSSIQLGRGYARTNHLANRL